MKKILLLLPVVALLATMAGCSQQHKWNHEQRKAVREALRDYRKMAYVENLTDAEFVLFSDEVALDLEGDYPVYATFISMPGVDDTVEMVVITTVVDELNADARNMRHLYPYEYMVEQDVLPTGLDREQQRAFYECFADKVNSYYYTMGQFFDAVLADTTDVSQIARFQQDCAADLFGWTVTEIDITEIDY